MVKMFQEGKVMAALSIYIKISWKVGIYYINGALLILNLAPLYEQSIQKDTLLPVPKQLCAPAVHDLGNNYVFA